MKISRILFILIFICGCTQPQIIESKISIKNSSRYNIELQSFGQDQSVTTIDLKKDSIKLFEETGKSILIPPPLNSDSIIVTFDNDISITHSRIYPESLNKFWYDEDSWVIDKKNEYSYEYEYIFTDEDYEEALERQ